MDTFEEDLTPDLAQDLDRRAMEICLTMPRDLRACRAILERVEAMLKRWEPRDTLYGDESGPQSTS